MTLSCIEVIYPDLLGLYCAYLPNSQCTNSMGLLCRADFSGFNSIFILPIMRGSDFLSEDGTYQAYWIIVGRCSPNLERA
jgi:hypothetical protein